MIAIAPPETTPPRTPSSANPISSRGSFHVDDGAASRARRELADGDGDQREDRGRRDDHQRDAHDPFALERESDQEVASRFDAPVKQHREHAAERADENEGDDEKSSGE